MYKQSMTLSFRQNLDSGLTRFCAWEAVTIEIQDLMNEYFDEGMDTTALSELLEWWCNLDYRTI